MARWQLILRSLQRAERTLQHLLRERAVTHGDRPFATLGGTTHSYAEVLDLAARRALTLRQAGVEQGDRVVALLPNGRELVELFFACIWSGAILVPVNTASKGPQLAHILENAEPALVVTDVGLAAQLASLNALPDATQAVGRSETARHRESGNSREGRHPGSATPSSLLGRGRVTRAQSSTHQAPRDHRKESSVRRRSSGGGGI